MSAISLSSNAEAALAAYASLTPGATSLATNLAALGAPPGVGMSQIQAEEFAIRFRTVVAQFNDTAAEGGTGTGLSVTVFKDATGNLTLAIRGTDRLAPGVGSDLPAGTDILGKGAAYDQIVALSNWWRRVSSPAGTMVAQHRIATYPGDGVPAGAVALDIGATVRALEDAPAVAATGTLVSAIASERNQRLDVTGHSLGAEKATQM